METAKKPEIKSTKAKVRVLKYGALIGREIAYMKQHNALLESQRENSERKNAKKLYLIKKLNNI